MLEQAVAANDVVRYSIEFIIKLVGSNYQKVRKQGGAATKVDTHLTHSILNETCAFTQEVTDTRH